MDSTELILAWLLVQRSQQGNQRQLEKALLPLLIGRNAPGEARERIASDLVTLKGGGAVEEQKERLRLTPAGRKRAQAALGLGKIPPGLNWKKLLSVQLPGLALAAPARERQRLSEKGALRRAVIARARGMPFKDFNRAFDALLWEQLGVSSKKRFDLEAVQAHLLGKALGLTVTSVEKGLTLLAAREASASRADDASLGQALVKRLLTSSKPEPLKRFAQRALDAAARSTRGRFGSNRVFISHAWEALQDRQLSLAAYKEKLLEANREAHLTLARADLVEAMNPADVAASEILGPARSTFHFVVVP